MTSLEVQKQIIILLQRGTKAFTMNIVGLVMEPLKGVSMVKKCELIYLI